jgi:hypothetical protein
MMLRNERRRFPRLPVQFLVQLERSVAGPHQYEYATNLSRTGLFIHTAIPPDVGSMIQVQFAPQKDSRLVQAFCRVARITPTGIGADFVQMDAESQALLRRVLAN